jgi:hypothetical protein
MKLLVMRFRHWLAGVFLSWATKLREQNERDLPPPPAPLLDRMRKADGQ